MTNELHGAVVAALPLGGILAGLIDSIAGGGGLITLPVLSFFLGMGPDAIGSNKIVGSAGALMALWVYARAGHFDLKKSLYFSVFVGLGSYTGSQTTPFVHPSLFPVFLLFSGPLILWTVWKKDLWIAAEVDGELLQAKGDSGFNFRLAFAGLCCGFYDGLWGPGGGTFMLLALVFVARLPLLVAVSSSKFANSVSAITALVSYSSKTHSYPGLTRSMAR